MQQNILLKKYLKSYLKYFLYFRYELEMAIHNRQEIRMKSCWYQMGGGRTYTSVTCHPTEYNVAVGDSTGRVVVYTGVFLHAQDTRKCTLGLQLK